MARRRHYRSRRRRHRARVSESSATYSVPLWYNGKQSNPVAGVAKVEHSDITQIVNEGTTNRKIVSIRGRGSLSTSITNGSLMLYSAFWAHPGIEDVPNLADFNPFTAGPNTPGSTTYEGRPSPRPFGRRLIVSSVEGNSAQTLFHDLSASTKAKRLIRPGWKLSHLLYTLSNAASVPYELAFLVNITVEG